MSGPSPFLACTAGQAEGAVVYDNTEVEPQVAVNPTDHDNVVGNFQQDRWSDGGARAGRCPLLRRRRVLVAQLRRVQRVLGQPGVSAHHRPVGQLRRGRQVDHRRLDEARHAYAVWIRGHLPGENISPVGTAHSSAFRGQPMFSKTTDGGERWSTPISMARNQNIYAQGNQIAVLPDGTLVNVVAVLFKGSGIQPDAANQVFMATTRSTDGGRHWSAMQKIAPIRTALLTDPDTPNPTSLTQTVRADDYLPDIAVDKDSGDLYVVWADGLGTRNNNVVISKSTDGARSWSTPRAIDRTPGPHAFNQTVTVGSDGTVAVLYYDFRDNTSDPDLPTDVWLTQSTDGGRTWSEQHVTGPFNMKQAPNARGWFLGDYMGLEPISDDGDLIAFFSTTQLDPANVYSVRANRTP